MKNLLRAFCIAFSMYSGIPMPQFKWEKEDMRYSICFFPLIGIVIGALCYGLCVITQMFDINLLAATLLFFVIPLIVTGGIHVDGFMDCSDVFSSYREKEKKLEILKDPHIGAFAVIRLVVLCAVYISAISIIISSEKGFEERYFIVICLGFVLSRTLSAVSVVSFPCAKNEGSLYTFAEGSDKKRCLSVLVKEAAIILLIMAVYGRIGGVVAITTALLTFGYYYLKTKKELGGITGDTAGWFVCLCETAMAVAICVCAMIGV
ncbi:adenosylcobinamide-GDP ribazoletransferase [Butyrivibrio sp. X503]|uniref:adenosylcobinamide-GDP ribazoletransferase n=1 Tax=Butyrivibrio sp. X503 TaxID=2364878 RepID=UPI000EA9875E|nr:adenosylcobinamide-GDP ribazoletransferase [Butyrivibrio sp. X503]RKM58330.1 adenosylcobinamide-GDP ribazoletransferase [Butyrivibrio sp. X503]